MSAIPPIGAGFGRTYTKPTETIPRETGRDETYVETIVAGKKVTVVRRNDVVPEDPYDNLARAAAFSIATGSIFPAPRIRRALKDHLIRTNITI